MPQAITLILQAVIVNAGWAPWVKAVVFIIVSAASASYARHNAPAIGEPSDDRRRVKRISDEPLVVLYGERRISGPLAFWATSGEALMMIIAHAEHEFESVVSAYIQDKLFTDPSLPSGKSITHYLGASGQTADATAVAFSSEWTSNHIGEGVAYTVAIFDSYTEWDSVPDVSIIAQGAKVYDPRLDTTKGGSGLHRDNDPSTWEYSTNPALHVRDYLTREEGFEEQHAKIDDDWVIASANVCDTLVDIPGAAQQPMYSCNVALSLAHSREENLSKLQNTMRGEVAYVGGRWIIMAGAYTVPTFTITEDDLVGDLSIAQSVSAAYTYNYVTGVYYDKDRFYQRVNFKPRSSAAFEVRDNNRRIPKDLKLTGVVNEYQAQRLAVLELNASEHQTTIQLQGKPSLMDLHFGALVYVTLDNPVWTNKVFRVTEWELNEDLTINVSLRDEFSTAWNVPVGIYDNADPASTYDPYSQFDVLPPENVYFDTGNSTTEDIGWLPLPIAEITWDPSPSEMVDGYRLGYRPVSQASAFSGAVLELQPKIFFRVDETSGLQTVNSGILGTTSYGTFPSDMSLFTVAGLGNEAGSAVDTDGNAARVMTYQYSRVGISRNFTMVVAFQVSVVTQNVTIFGQWEGTTATQAMRLGTEVAGNNVCFHIRETDLTLRTLDSGSTYSTGSHLAVITLRNNILALEIDGVEVATFNAAASTFITDDTIDWTAGGGAGGSVFNGIWDDAVVVDYALTDYEKANLYSLWSSGAVATGLEEDWVYSTVGEDEREWRIRLLNERFYDFSIETVNQRGLRSTPELLNARQVRATDSGPDQIDAISYNPRQGGIQLIADCLNVVNYDIDYMEIAYNPTNDRDDSATTFVRHKVSSPKVGGEYASRYIEAPVNCSGLNYFWARLVNTAEETGAWHDVATSGLETVSGEAGYTNFIDPQLRGLFSKGDNYVFNDNGAFYDAIPLTKYNLTAGENYLSCGSYISDDGSGATSASISIEFINFSDTVISTATSVSITPGATQRVILEGVLIPVNTARFRMVLNVNSNTVSINDSVLNQGVSVIDPSSAYSDRFLDPNDNDANVEDWYDNQNLLDGSVEDVEDNTATTGTGAGGGPFDIEPVNGGGYYELP